jgi:hypothetical protein
MMTLYIIRGDAVTAYASAPARALEDKLRVRSAKEIETSGLSNAQMAAIWNALPGTTPVAKFKDRKRPLAVCRANRLGGRARRYRSFPLLIVL